MHRVHRRNALYDASAREVSFAVASRANQSTRISARCGKKKKCFLSSKFHGSESTRLNVRRKVECESLSRDSELGVLLQREFNADDGRDERPRPRGRASVSKAPRSQFKLPTADRAYAVSLRGGSGDRGAYVRITIDGSVYSVPVEVA